MLVSLHSCRIPRLRKHLKRQPRILKYYLVDAVKSCHCDDSYQYRSQVADADHPQFLHFKGEAVLLDLLHQILRVPFPAYIIAHGEASQGEQKVISDHTHKVEHAVVENLHLAEDAEGQGAWDACDENCSSDDKGGFLPGPSQGIYGEGHRHFQKSDGTGDCGKKYQGEKQAGKHPAS